jgi:hypothetical protein
MACVFDMLIQCQSEDNMSAAFRQNNIHRIADTLDRIYSRKCDEGRFRGKTS